MAIASFVLGVLGGLLFSVVFGIVALAQIARRGQRGKGLAIGGLVASGAWVVVLAVFLVWAVATEVERSPSGAISRSGELPVEDLRVGDCLNDLQENPASWP